MLLCACRAVAAPTLEDLLAAARALSVATNQARGEVGVARAGMAGARVSFFRNPYLEVQMDHGHYTKNVQITSFLMMPVELNNQRGARIQENEALTAWREAALAQAEIDVDAQVVAGWGQLLVSEGRVAVALGAEEDAQARAHNIDERLHVNDATLVDSSLAQAEVVRWRMLRAENELARVAARTALAELTGITIADTTLDDARAPMPRPLPLDGLVDAALHGAPGLRVLTDERRYQTASRTLASRERFLPLTFIINGGHGDKGEWRAGGGLSYTFPVSRRKQGEIAQAGAEVRRLDAVVERLRNVVGARARGAVARLQLSIDAVHIQEQAGIPTALRLVDAAWESYRAGKGELLRVLIARRDLALARDRRLDFVERAWRAYADLISVGAVRP